MSFTVFINKFEHGKGASFDLKELEAITAKYGSWHSGDLGLEFHAQEKDLFETTDLFGSEEATHTSISILRPNAKSRLKELIFDLLELPGTCFFTQDLEAVYVRNTPSHQLPKDLVSQTDWGIIQVAVAKELMN